MRPKEADGTANSIDPDQTAPKSHLIGSIQFAQTCLSIYLGS